MTKGHGYMTGEVGDYDRERIHKKRGLSILTGSVHLLVILLCCLAKSAQKVFDSLTETPHVSLPAQDI